MKLINKKKNMKKKDEILSLIQNFEKISFSDEESESELDTLKNLSIEKLNKYNIDLQKFLLGNIFESLFKNNQDIVNSQSILDKLNDKLFDSPPQFEKNI